MNGSPPLKKGRPPAAAAKLREPEADSGSSVNDLLNFSNSAICRIILRPLQAAPLKPFLDESKTRTGLTGVLCVISQSYNADAGGTVVELQACKVSRHAVRKIEKILRDEIAKKEDAS